MSKFRRPDDNNPGFLHPDDDPRKLMEVEKSQFVDDGPGSLPAFNPYINRSMEQQRQRLPVFHWRNHILYLLERNRVVIIVGETGCGKSTQIPQYLYESGWLQPGHIVAITQPRRIAAVSLASRVAEEKSWTLGQKVGYAIRFEECHNPQSTVIKYVTDGMLLREVLRDPLLSNYRVIMIDEAHELTISTDLLIALLKKVLRKRPNDLRIIISSATLQAEKFHDFFSHLELGDNAKASVVFADEASRLEHIVANLDQRELHNCAIMSVQGRQYPVQMHYSIDPVPCFMQCAYDTVLRLHKQHSMEGDMLVFVSGESEVHQLVGRLFDTNQEALQHCATAGKRCHRMRPLPLYGSLPLHDQLKVFDRPQHNMRKVVVATNIAEASLTLPNIQFVLDCGFAKVRAFHPVVGLHMLTVVPVSQAAANQRAGRAARTRSGHVYRLYTEAAYLGLSTHTPAEMERCDLAHAILQIKAMGIDNFQKFAFFTKPPAENLERALELLYALGALDQHARLTSPLGQRMAELPLHPMASAMLFAAVEFHCVKEAACIAALLQVQNVFHIPASQRKTAEKFRRKFACFEGDHLTLLNALYTFQKKSPSLQKVWCQSHFLNYKSLQRACQLRDQIRRQVVEKFRLPWTSCRGDVAAIVKALVKGFFSQVARLSADGSHYVTVRGEHELHLHPNSVLYPEKWPHWVLFTDTVLSNKLYMECVTVIEPQLLYTLAPHYYDYGTEREILHKTVSTYRTDSVF